MSNKFIDFPAILYIFLFMQTLYTPFLQFLMSYDALNQRDFHISGYRIAKKFIPHQIAPKTF